MSLQRAKTSGMAAPGGPSREHNHDGVPLSGVWLAVARLIWIASLFLQLGVFVASLPVFYNGQLAFAATPPMRDGLLQIGLAPAFYATSKTALHIVSAGVFGAVATIIFWRTSQERFALFISFVLVVYGVSLPVGDHRVALPSALAWMFTLVSFIGFAALSPFLYLFPDGSFVPRWTRWVTPLWIAIQASVTILPNALLGIWGWPPLLMIPTLCAFLGSLVFAPIYRYVRVASSTQRQQIKWVVYAFAINVLFGFGALFLRVAFPKLMQPGTPIYLLGEGAGTMVQLAVPMTIGIAILRYRLWDIDPLINRTLVYSGLTASIVGLYVVIVGGIGALLEARGNPAIALLATGVVAVMFQPLRVRLQRGVNRLMYGERDEPYVVLSRLGQRLEATLAPDTVLPTIVETIKDALKLPYVAIALKQAESVAIVAASGEARDATHAFPLIYQHESVGHLILAPRSPDESFSPADRRLLEDLARQVGVAAHAVRLTADLQRARERLVTSREEERRRIRRALYEELEPGLVGLDGHFASLRALIPDAPAAAHELVPPLRRDLRTAIADIRRLVQDLRPPALDELGLVGAIREIAAQMSTGGRLTGTGADPYAPQIVIDAPLDLPLLSAAVEVAAYRIVQAALTSIVQQTQARTCVVRLSITDALYIEVMGDGGSLRADDDDELGLRVIHERAEELGGTCVIETVAAGGTHLQARLPLLKG